MSVPVVHASEFDPIRSGRPPLSCLLCRLETYYWWGNGCAPLCQECAETATQRKMRLTVLARSSEGLGHLPPRPDPVPDGAITLHPLRHPKQGYRLTCPCGYTCGGLATRQHGITQARKHVVHDHDQRWSRHLMEKGL